MYTTKDNCLVLENLENLNKAKILLNEGKNLQYYNYNYQEWKKLDLSGIVWFSSRHLKQYSFKFRLNPSFNDISLTPSLNHLGMRVMMNPQEFKAKAVYSILGITENSFLIGKEGGTCWVKAADLARDYVFVKSGNFTNGFAISPCYTKQL